MRATDLHDLSEGQLDAGPGQRARTVRFTGLALGLALAVLSGLALPESLELDARVTASVVVLMGTWWVTEAVPLPVTALVPLVAFPMFGVSAMEEVAGSYANQIIFLFLGGFLLALGIQRWNLHRRIALLIVLAVGTRPTRMIAGLMIATAVLGMWVSNTATALMMVPLGTSLVALVEQEARRGRGADTDGTADNAAADQRKHSRFGIGLMLAIAYSATFSAFGTIIASPGNIFVVGYIRDTLGYEVTFLQWMLFGMPLLVVFLFLGWLVIAKWLWRPEVDDLPGGRELFARELAKLGRMSAGEVGISVVFAMTALAWILVPVLFEEPWATDAVIAMMGGMTTFLIPASPRRGVMLMNWDTGLRTPWGVLILFGGGLALSAQVTGSGLADWIGESLGVLGGMPVWVLAPIVVILVLIFTEFTSSMATIATFVPLVSGVAAGLGHDPVIFAIMVTQACQCAFMLPVASAPNAIVFATGSMEIRDMVRTGLWMNAVGFVLVTLLALWGLPLVLG
ncbi:SLC13 family permease [Citricoccus muralis]|uniref:Sodium-dependent dicarboxylate transporter SdcS n=1 Tax=Citricoccus muralis TaxID=169134 RepID=A0ABY8H702_9MICC|nr:DASS family sodium-coupled anion symporter [Citricoccus muralis]WFP16929.1 DASS family sodium-coupled anion symporter [Citricoccus muralis]